MSNTTQLRQLQNTVEIVGTLKSKDLEVKTSRAGNQYMSGKLVVESVFDNKVQEQVVKVMVMATSKLFKGIETVKNEYKTIEADGRENADRVRITGELKINRYYGQDGALREFNEIKGVFYNRLDPSNDQPDKAIASIEVIVDGFNPVLDKEQLPTGEYNVTAFTVGWGNDVIDLKKLTIGAELAQPFMDLYTPGSTGRMNFKLNNYVVVQENTNAAATHGFGSKETAGGTIEKYVSNIEIIGGDIPYFQQKEYTFEEIETAKKVKALVMQSLEKPSDTPPSTPPTGFGNSGDSQTQTNKDNIDITEDDMPDF